MFSGTLTHHIFARYCHYNGKRTSGTQKERSGTIKEGLYCTLELDSLLMQSVRGWRRDEQIHIRGVLKLCDPPNHPKTTSFGENPIIWAVPYFDKHQHISRAVGLQTSQCE